MQLCLRSGWRSPTSFPGLFPPRKGRGGFLPLSRERGCGEALKSSDLNISISCWLCRRYFIRQRRTSFINSVLPSSPTKTWGISKNSCFSRQQTKVYPPAYMTLLPSKRRKKLSPILSISQTLKWQLRFPRKSQGSLPVFFFFYPWLPHWSQKKTGLFWRSVGYPDSGQHAENTVLKRSIEKLRHTHHTKKRTTYYWIPFTLTYQPHNLSVKASSLKTSKFDKNDPETSQIFSLPPVVSCEGVKK